MKKLFLLSIIAVALIIIVVVKNKDSSKISEKDVLKIHISGKRTR